MAETPVPKLVFRDGCPDCGERRVEPPKPLPRIGDDFDWRVRDYDGFREFMRGELVARYPERSRWTAADVEVVLVESLAAILDELSDELDRVTAEAFLDTARRPQSVRRLLALIGYDAVEQAWSRRDAPFDGPRGPDETWPDEAKRPDRESRLDAYWLAHPHRMHAARIEGPRRIDTQRRMVTLADHAIRLEEHPLVERAQARERWAGSWSRIEIAVVPWRQRDLDAWWEGEGVEPSESEHVNDEMWERVSGFHSERGIPLVDRDAQPSIRSILRSYLDAYRMAGRQVLLERAVEVGIMFSASIQVDPNYFRSEVRRAVERALGTGPGGFFQHGRLRFGEDLHAGDLFQVLMRLDGVENVCLNRFKRLGDRFPDQSESGRIVLSGLEVAVCDNLPTDPNRGYYYLKLSGGRTG